MQPQGPDVDIARLIASKIGVKAELIPTTTANRIPYLQTHRADLVISTLGKNPEREKVIDFAMAYSPFFIAVFGPKTTVAAYPAALAGKSIGAGWPDIACNAEARCAKARSSRRAPTRECCSRKRNKMSMARSCRSAG